MKLLEGWDGPVGLAEGVFRYSKCLGWIRLCIDVEGSDFWGSTSGASKNFEVACEDGRWMRFPTELARTAQGDLVLRLRGMTTWDVVYERTSEGVPLKEGIQSLEDLAAYLERCLRALSIEPPGKGL